MWKLADLLESHADEIAELESLDNGKPIRDARNVDLPGSYEILRYMAGWATKIKGSTIRCPRPATGTLYVVRAGRRRRPDHPVELPADDGGVEDRTGAGRGLHDCPQAGRADAASAIRLGQLIQEAGFPDGVVNI